MLQLTLDQLAQVQQYTKAMCADREKLEEMLAKEGQLDTHRKLEGDERDHMLTALALIGPLHESNNQQFNVEYYEFNNKQYCISYIISESPILEEIIYHKLSPRSWWSPTLNPNYPHMTYFVDKKI